MNNNYLYIYISKFTLLIMVFFLNIISIYSANLVKDSLTFYDDVQPLELMISIPLKSLLRDVDDPRTWHRGYIALNDKSGQICEMPIRICTRGYFRRNPQHCSFPPLLFDFPDNFRPNNALVGLKKTKLVTHCRNSSQAEQFVFLEYLIYKIYNILSDESYQVRLAKIHWIDTQGDYEAYQKWGFIIENTQQLEARLGGKFINIQNVHQDKTNYDKITRLALFEFMIGNTDWGVSSLHNIKLLINDPYKPPIAIPYDFDWSGFVNAPYAVPLPDFGTKSVRVRVYRGYYRQMDELNRVITEFLEKKDSIFELVQNFSYLNEANKSQALDYLMEFYSIIENPKRIHKEFIENCRDEN